jgi:hypothetical protein
MPSIRSRRRSSGGDGRQKQCESDHTSRRTLCESARRQPENQPQRPDVTAQTPDDSDSDDTLARDMMKPYEAMIERDAADVLRCCRAALELDGQNHDYGVYEWLPVAYHIAAPLLEHARLDREPPSVVEHVQDAIGWLARAIVNLDQDSADTSAALSDAIGRLLVVCAFANAAGDRRGDA